MNCSPRGVDATLLGLVLLAFAIQPTPVCHAGDDAAGLGATITQLGNEDPRLRDAAELDLFKMGRSAEPVLIEAAKSGNPEIALRARRVLGRLRLGIFPDTPPIIVNLLRAYRTANVTGRSEIVRQIQARDPKACRTLGLLWLHEKNSADREAIYGSRYVLEMPQWAQELVAGGDDAGAAEMVRSFEFSGSDRVARAAASYYLLDGSLGKQISEVERTPIDRLDRPALLFLVFAHRATGDADGAWRFADKLGDQRILAAIAAERGDWAGAAKAMRNVPEVYSLSMQRSGRLLAYERLAGHQSAAEEIFQKLSHATLSPDDLYKLYFFNDRPAEGVARLLSDPAAANGPQREESDLVVLLCEQLRFREAIDLANKNRRPPQMILPIARRLRWLGAIHAGDDLLDEAHRYACTHRDLLAYGLLARSLGQLGLNERARQICFEAFEVIGDNDGTRRLLLAWCTDTHGLRDPMYWLAALRSASPLDPVVQWVSQANDLFTGKLPKELAKSILSAARDDPQVANDLHGRLSDLVRLTAENGLHDPTVEFLAWSFKGDQPLIALGDVSSEQGNWDAAARVYGAAWERRNRMPYQMFPLALILEGRALEKAGHPRQGHDLVERGHRTFIDGDWQRHALVSQLEAHGLAEDAQRQLDLAVRVGTFDDSDAGICLRNRANKLGPANPLAAASIWTRWLVGSLSESSTVFDAAQSYLVVPLPMHRWQAAAFEARGDRDAAAQEWRVCADYLPAEADYVQAAVRLLDAQGRRVEADEMYAPARDRISLLCTDYPDSALAHNQLAWLAARCRRELDLALEQANVATRLSPNQPDYLDTLAEAYLARGQKTKAIDLMHKVLSLAPDRPEFKDRLKEIEAAK
jgi:tetratricopeptide (TPR) repeat protein